MQPFYLAYHEQNNRDLLAAHGRLCTTLMGDWQRRVGVALPASAERGHKKPRVGIVSAQICTHPVYMAITRGWLRRLDRQRFELDIFHLGTKTDAETVAARGFVDYFEEGVRSISAWAEAILARRPDVACWSGCRCRS
jgi:protein O-GlcNAc transferase